VTNRSEDCPVCLIRFPSAALQRQSRLAELLPLLKRMIGDGLCQPGQCLPSKPDLTRQLGVSRLSFRETVRALTAMNILEVRHGAGAFVSSLDAELLPEPL
jgi:GntR family transcriptional repressor for pyruvate dehydrogenase complex